jgi:hypothetical protein
MFRFISALAFSAVVALAGAEPKGFRALILEGLQLRLGMKKGGTDGR